MGKRSLAKVLGRFFFSWVCTFQIQEDQALPVEKGICEAGAGQAKHFVQLLFSKVYYYYFLIA